MGHSPTLIFDKSALQSLNPDESVWLDSFFTTNITPLFFVETLADLEKQVRSGRTPEQVVGNLALKTPDLQSRLNAHHATLLTGELAGLETVAMDGRPISTGAQPVALGGNMGLVFPTTPEEEAFSRWQRHEFLDLERQLAKMWRRSLSAVNYDQMYQFFQKWFRAGPRPSTLTEVKALADANIDDRSQEAALQCGISLLGVSDAGRQQVMARWQGVGRPALREFAPYFRHMFSVDLFFYLAIAADLISRSRPVGKADNKVDLAYLYYLPFCKVFTSNDNLHERIVPLFLREDQTFIKGAELKDDLRKLDDHYSSLPEDVKVGGLHHFADYPPTDSSFLVTRLWDKHVPAWRERSAKKQEISQDAKQALRQLINRLQKEAQPVNPDKPPTVAEANWIMVEREVPFQKGKWRRFPPEAERKRSG